MRIQTLEEKGFTPEVCQEIVKKAFTDVGLDVVQLLKEGKTIKEVCSLFVEADEKRKAG